MTLSVHSLISISWNLGKLVYIIPKPECFGDFGGDSLTFHHHHHFGADQPAVNGRYNLPRWNVNGIYVGATRATYGATWNPSIPVDQIPRSARLSAFFGGRFFKSIPFVWVYIVVCTNPI